ncbi:MAG TPA: hypothetical protein VKV57_01590 [bacterium]|nr:hypothetical protein [bacterium]
MQITYAGGPVVRRPLVYSSFWGPGWTDPVHQAQASQLNQFHQDLLNSSVMDVLTQYGILGPGAGAFVNASFLPWVPRVLTVAKYQNIIQSNVLPGALPPQQAGSHVILLYLDEHIIINDPATGRQLNFLGAYDVGYHEFFTTAAGDPVYYGFVAYSANTDDTTTVASHEFAEIITDPEYDAWSPDGGMTEIGDLCEQGQDTITVGANRWTVQKIWSNIDNSCVCRASHLTWEIQPGPAQKKLPSAAAGWRCGKVRAI